MSGRREDDAAITLGEVYRRLVDIDERWDSKLNAIDQQVRITNGRTTTLEAEMKAVKADVQRLTPPFQTPPSLPIMTNEGESLSVKISPKMWLTIAAAGSATWLALWQFAKWVENLIERAK